MTASGPTGPGRTDFSERDVPAGGQITDVSGQYVIHTTATQQIVLKLGDSAGPEVTRAPGAAALDGEILWTAGANAGDGHGVRPDDEEDRRDGDDGRRLRAHRTPGARPLDLYWTCGDKAGVYDRTAKKSVTVPTA